MNATVETLKAYEHWAPLYPPVAHNPLMRGEQIAMAKYWPEIAGARALDLACGSGRYSRLLSDGGAAEVISLDFCLPMLMQVANGAKVCASMMCLPFANGTFDVVISGLALGHADNVHSWMAEVARVLGKGGVLLYSDFHPEAVHVGLTRSFKGLDDQTHSVPHHNFDVATQIEAVKSAHLTVDALHEVRVGAELNEPFSKSENFYQQWHGLPIVLVMRARK
jgi:malonyl-CoA O-methyltransferase